VSNLRVLVTTDQWSPDAIGGSARVAADSARALVRRGHQLTVIAPAADGLPPHAVEDGVEIHRVLHRYGVPQTFADPVATRHAVRALDGRTFDVALAHQNTNATGVLSARLNVPVVHVFHASVVLEQRFLRRRTSLGPRLARIALDPCFGGLERHAVSRAAALIVLSEFSRDVLVSRHPDAAPKIHRVEGGVADVFFGTPDEPRETVRHRYGLAQDGALLVTVRRLEPRMGVDELVRAVARLESTDFVLVVAGDGMERERLGRLTEELGVAGRVRFAGRLPESDLRSLYAAADLFVLPTVAYEGFGMSTVESLASGTPVLGTAVGATPEILTALDPALVVESADPDRLAAGIEGALPRLGPELRARSRDYALHHYDWDVVVTDWEDALRAVVRIDDADGLGNL